MTRQEIDAEIKAQKGLIDEYAAQVQRVLGLISEREGAQDRANKAGAAQANGCAELARVMKKLGIGLEPVKRFIDNRDALYHIEQELNRK